MKNKIIWFLVLLVSGLFILSGCGNKNLTISYYSDGKVVKTQTYTDSIDDLYNAQREGYEFKGWFLDEELTKPFDQSKSSEYFKEGQINLYASWSEKMKDFNIKAKGKYNDKYAVNPSFSWDNSKGDTSFSITIKDSISPILMKTITENYFVMSEPLDFNTEFEFIVKGNDSGIKESFTFTTIEDGGYNLSQKLVVDNPYFDNMVIQRGKDIVVSGVGPAMCYYEATFGEEKYEFFADGDGKWSFTSPAKEASFTPFDISISTLRNDVKISNVVIGDVYLFAGQSNMQWPTSSSDYLQSDVDSAVNNKVRFFTQNVAFSEEKKEYVTKGYWFVANSGNVKSYSAIAFMSAALLSNEVDVPIGILSAYQGDTNIANWMGSEYYQGTCSTKCLHYNSMIYPLRHANVKGVVWYQGCNNSAAGGEYKGHLLDLFRNYRELFNNDNMPFYVIGLACYDGDSGNNYDFSYVREAQAAACEEDENAYFISTCDDGDPSYIHPSTKHYICERVAKSIAATQYGADYLATGPSYKTHTVNGNKVIVEFNHAEGLHSVGTIDGVMIAGADGKYYSATAEIKDGKLYASSTKVTNPVYIKYGFGKSPFVSVFNKDGFAITPFRTDVDNINIDLLDYDSTSLYHFHPDGSKMTVSISNNNLVIKKSNDGIGYGSVRLDKWGMIGNNPLGFKFTVIGTNSGAKIQFRCIEGPSSEIWGYSFIDNFVGEKTFTAYISEFSAVYGKADNIFDTQAISYVEVMIEAPGAATITVKEARFIEVERTSPMPFRISEVTEDNGVISIRLSESPFADKYHIVVSSDGKNFTNPVFEQESTSKTYSFDINGLDKSLPYFIKVTASNELGTGEASNNGLVFYLKNPNVVILSNFDFPEQSSLDAFIESNMKVHVGLTCTLQDEGIKITSSGAGWQNFIFVCDKGANKGMSKVTFKADFTNYQGEVVMELVDTSWNIYVYNLNITTKKSGTYTIDFSKFILKNSTTPFSTQSLMWVSFNFSDTAGGEILFDDCQLLK